MQHMAVCGLSLHQGSAESRKTLEQNFSVYKQHTIHNFLIRSDEGLTLETSAFESLYGGQLTLSTQLIKPNYYFFKQGKLSRYLSKMNLQRVTNRFCLFLEQTENNLTLNCTLCHNLFLETQKPQKRFV